MESMATHDDVDRIICLTGPESSGKTTLAQTLAERFDVPLVAEAARAYLEEKGSYGPDDLLEIARLQIAAERRARAEHRGLLICDTDLLVIGIWYREKYATLPEFLTEQLSKRSARGYLLLEPDLPWTPDPQRENPTDRWRLYDRYLAELDASRFPYRIVGGPGHSREETALVQLRSLLGELSTQLLR
jgi:nicotinamide riboside kinase